MYYRTIHWFSAVSLLNQSMHDSARVEIFNHSKWHCARSAFSFYHREPVKRFSIFGYCKRQWARSSLGLYHRGPMKGFSIFKYTAVGKTFAQGIIGNICKKLPQDMAYQDKLVVCATGNPSGDLWSLMKYDWDMSGCQYRNILIFCRQKSNAHNHKMWHVAIIRVRFFLKSQRQFY